MIQSARLAFLVLMPLATLGRAATDEVARQWLERSALASKHLAELGLDACDIALDKAFEHPKEIQNRMFRTFELAPDINGQTLKVQYSFREGQLASFELVSLPATWIARQRATTKTLSVLVTPARCAMDFCTNNPFVLGACAGDTAE